MRRTPLRSTAPGAGFGLPPSPRRRSRPRALAALSVALGAFAIAALGAAPTASAATCATANVLSGSAFEIDTSANLKVDGAAPCIDWLDGGTGTALRSGVLAKDDKPTGSADDSFGQGTAENDANPTIVTGSIPPNKSDLKKFGVFTETGTTAKFLELFWARVQNPSGTTNMDFELNQKFCDPTATPTNCADNGKSVTTPETPLRTAGDKLITYDLSKGGTVPTISIRTWSGTVWGAATVISGGASPLALGAVNTASIPATESGGIGALDPFTFGEAAINFSAIFTGGGCGKFGSVYLKSRSSDSFTSEVKDFIAPERVNITNCTGIVTKATATATIGSPISDTATLSGASANAGGTITFHLYSDSQCQNEVTTGLSPVSVSGNGDYNSGNFTPSAAGSYYWTASYSGDAKNSAASTLCGDANETSVVEKRQPALVTTATVQVVIGSPISDTATLSGATSGAGGTITFHLYSDPLCATEVTTGLSPVTVSGNGDYNSGNFTPSAVGSYYWTASYSGDANNKPASTACGDLGETSEVVKAPANIGTAQELFPQDAATVTASAGGAPTGSVTFALYAAGDTTCSGSAVFSQTVALSNGAAATSNTTFSVKSASASTYRWRVVYSGDAKHEGATSTCGTEQFTLTIANG